VPENWSRGEVEAAVADYFAMLTLELRGQEFNKAEHNRQLQLKLNDRSHGSIERKHQNISAILIECGYPYIEGYKPLGNYQELLWNVVEARLTGAAAVNAVVADVVEQPVAVEAPSVDDLLAILVDPPTREEKSYRAKEKAQPVRRPVRRNYLEIEARNSSLGRAGEELAVRFEQERLRSIGERMLAENVQLVSRTLGDHLGFDVLSFERNGRERLIEVKTTRFGAWTPFFASRNEVNVSENRAEQYQLYRVFSFSSEPRLFTLPGSLRKTCRLDPYTYSALPA
jgi:Domain of unknown function (DUF3883)